MANATGTKKSYLRFLIFLMRNTTYIIGIGFRITSSQLDFTVGCSEHKNKKAIIQPAIP